MKPPRIALIGARRVRQGLGPFVARFLAAEGAEVPAFLGTSASSVATAAEQLERTAGLAPRGYTSLEDMLAREELDALAILSPAETHGRYLEAALEAGLHALCEKPLIWGGGGLADRARRLVDGFEERGLLLRENCQWPFALPAFRALHPEAADEPLRSFVMRLSPSSRGAQMIGDALPHPLSVLQELVPARDAWLENLTFSTHAPGAEELVLRFDFVTPTGAVDCRVELIHGDSLPREASLTLNGRAGRRRVRLEDYAQFLGVTTDEGVEREVPLPDPLCSLLREFVADLAAAPSPAAKTRDTDSPTAARDHAHRRYAMITLRMTLLETLLTAFRASPQEDAP